VGINLWASRLSAKKAGKPSAAKMKSVTEENCAEACDTSSKCESFMVLENKKGKKKCMLYSKLAKKAKKTNAECFVKDFVKDAPSQICPNAKMIRRSLHTYTDKERKALLDAMAILVKYSTEEGQKIYGKNFINYFVLTVYHWGAAATLPCDYAHGSSGFWPWHRSLAKRFEMALQAVDPKLTLPYYDMARDMDEVGGVENLSKSKFWSSAWFGSLIGDPSDGYQVKDSYFGKKWKIPLQKDLPEAPSSQANVHGILREPSNPNPNRFVTRMGTLYGQNQADYISFDTKSLSKMTKDTSLSYGEFDGQVNDLPAGIHAGLHYMMGAYASDKNTGADLPQYPEGDKKNNFFKMDDFTKQLINVLVSASGSTDIVNGCMGPPPTCTADSPIEDCFWRVVDLEKCQNIIPIDGFKKSPFFMANLTLGVSAEMGSFHGVSDPIFMFHHANLDRLFMEYQTNLIVDGKCTVDDGCGFKEYAQGKCMGNNWDDPLSGMPTNGAIQMSAKGMYLNVNKNKQPTVGQTVPIANVDYTYDTICSTV